MIDSFSALALADPLLRTLDSQGYRQPTPIQAAAIPPLLDGRDLLGIAQTGTGKTAAFALPVLQRLMGLKGAVGQKKVRVLILAPTRELAQQIFQSIGVYGSHLALRRTVVFGGAPIGKQAKILKKGVDVLVATPGRLLDLMRQDYVDIGQVCTFVLDEADRMLDMGFIHDVNTIHQAQSGKQQTIMFSATMPRTVEKLAGRLLKNPQRVKVTPKYMASERVAQKVMFVAKNNKRQLLLQMLKQTDGLKRALVFSRTKYGADNLATYLRQNGLKANALHGEKRQFVRKRILDDFKFGKGKFLIATDVVARGIDVSGLTHVVNFDVPTDPESYVHRIGRTGRAGEEGVAMALCSPEEITDLRRIEKLLGRSIEVDAAHAWHMDLSKAGFARPIRKNSKNANNRRAKTQKSKRSNRHNAKMDSGNTTKHIGDKKAHFRKSEKAQAVPSNQAIANNRPKRSKKAQPSKIKPPRPRQKNAA